MIGVFQSEFSVSRSKGLSAVIVIMTDGSESAEPQGPHVIENHGNVISI